MRITVIIISVFCFGLIPVMKHNGDAIGETGLIPSVKTIFFRLGNKNIPIKIQQYGKKTGVVFISLHDDEATSVSAAKTVLEKEGGLLIELENNRERNIRFRAGNRSYAFDPNRIFSKNGITKSLEENGRSSKMAIGEIQKLAARILQLIPTDPVCVIALHNNSSGLYSAVSYTSGFRRAGDARKVFINEEQDADNFFLITDEKLFRPLADAGYNTVLQDNRKCTDDGSLSVYCGKKNIRYVNIETEHDRPELYAEMIKTLIMVLPN